MDRELIQLVQKVGLAVASVYHNTVVGCDTRTSSSAMKHAAVSGLLAAGSRCYDAGVLPTPALALAAKEYDAGVMITASHNPPEYNGIKLLNPDGAAFDSSQTGQIEAMVSDGAHPAAPWPEMTGLAFYQGAVEQHIERVLEDFPGPLKLKVVLDCGCGAGAVITPYLLRKMGCDVIGINCYTSGFFPHDVEPIEANLSDLMKTTRELGADLGIAHDGDADRMMVVDDRGRFVSGDKLLVILARAVGAREVVTTLDASMVIDEMGFGVTRTRVGDTYVSEGVKKGGDFGGEPSGAWIFPGISLCPDGIYAAARIVSLASQQRLSRLADDIPSYPLIRGSIGSEGMVISKMEQRLMAMKPLSVSKIDGIKLNFKEGWLLVRPSGTEPKIRITAEARSQAEVHRLYDRGTEAIKESVR